MAPHRGVVWDPNSVRRDSGPGVGRGLRPASLPWCQDLRTRLILAVTPHRSALPRTSDVPASIALSRLRAKSRPDHSWPCARPAPSLLRTPAADQHLDAHAQLTVQLQPREARPHLLADG